MNGLMPIPSQLKRFIQRLRADGSEGAIRFIRLETVIGIFVDALFPGFQVRSQGAFRVLRDSDIEVQEEAEDLVRSFEIGAEEAAPRLGDPARDRGLDAGHASSTS